MLPLPGFMYAVLVDLPAEQHYTPNTPHHRDLELPRFQSGVFPARRARCQKLFLSNQPPLLRHPPQNSFLVARFSRSIRYAITHSIASQLSLKSRNVHILRCTFHERNALPIFLTFATSEGRVKYEAFDKAECVTLGVAGSQWTLQWSDAA